MTNQNLECSFHNGQLFELVQLVREITIFAKLRSVVWETLVHSWYKNQSYYRELFFGSFHNHLSCCFNNQELKMNNSVSFNDIPFYSEFHAIVLQMSHEIISLRQQKTISKEISEH